MIPNTAKIPIRPEKRNGSQFVLRKVRRKNKTAATKAEQPIRNRASPSTGDRLISPALRERKIKPPISIKNHNACHQLTDLASRIGQFSAALPAFGTSTRKVSTPATARTIQGLSSTRVA